MFPLLPLSGPSIYTYPKKRVALSPKSPRPPRSSPSSASKPTPVPQLFMQSHVSHFSPWGQFLSGAHMLNFPSHTSWKQGTVESVHRLNPLQECTTARFVFQMTYDSMVSARFIPGV